MEKETYTLESGIRLLKGLVLLRQESTLELEEDHVTFMLSPERRGKVDDLKYSEIKSVSVRKAASIFFTLIGGACLFWALMGFITAEAGAGLVGLACAGMFLWQSMWAALVIQTANGGTITLRSFSVADALQAGTSLCMRAGIGDECRASFPALEAVKLIGCLVAGFVLPFLFY